MKQIVEMRQHRSLLKHMNSKMKTFIKENYPEIKDTDMVEILETRTFELVNHWSPQSNKNEQLVYLYEERQIIEDILEAYIELGTYGLNDDNIRSSNYWQDKLRDINSQIKELGD